MRSRSIEKFGGAPLRFTIIVVLPLDFLVMEKCLRLGGVGVQILDVKLASLRKKFF